MEDKSSVWIKGDKDSVWDAITNEDKLSQWYVPGSPWEIPNLEVGEKANFTLMPSVYNNLTEKLPMTLSIEKIIPFHVFGLFLDAQQTSISFVMEEENGGIKVSMNSTGFAKSLANLKALIEKEEIPYV